MTQNSVGEGGKHPWRITRRRFIGDIAAVLALEAFLRAPDALSYLDDLKQHAKFRRPGFEKLSSEERERHIREEAAAAEKLIRSTEGQRILERGTDEEIFALLDAMPKILRSHIRGTSFDVPKDEWPSVGMGFSTTDDFALVFPSSSFEEIRGKVKANAVFVGPNKILTNLHVLSGLGVHVPELEKLWHEHGIDAVYITVPSTAPRISPDRLKIRAVSKKTDSELHGTFIKIPSLHAGDTADAEGTKQSISTCIRLNKRLAGFLERCTRRKIEWKEIRNCFLYITQPGESALRFRPSHTGSRLLDTIVSARLPDVYARSQGVSGSPVLPEPDDGTVVGLDALSAPMWLGEASLDCGIFYGPDSLRNAEKTMSYTSSGVSVFGYGGT